MDLNIISYNYFSKFLIVFNCGLDTQESIECVSSFNELASELCLMLTEDIQTSFEKNQEPKIKSIMIVDSITKAILVNDNFEEA